MFNWTNVDFKKTLRWYNKIKSSNKSIVKSVHLEKMKKWTYDKKKGVIKHSSGEFFHIEGKRIIKSDREVKSWDQPFIKQVDYNGGIIGLVRSDIKGIPHYLIDAKYEPGNYNKIQISPSLQATYSNLNRIHKGEKNMVVKKYFSTDFLVISFNTAFALLRPIFISLSGVSSLSINSDKSSKVTGLPSPVKTPVDLLPIKVQCFSN